MHHAGRCIVTRMSDSMHAGSGTTHGTMLFAALFMCICFSRGDAIIKTGISSHAPVLVGVVS